MNVEVNYVAILVASIASMAVGFLWYGPVLFAKPWMKLMGYTKEGMEKAKKEMGKTYGISFLFTLLSAYVLTHIMALSQNFYGYSPVMTGATSAFWVWLGFVMPVQATVALFGGGNWKLFWINTGYQLASLVAMGVVIGLMK